MAAGPATWYTSGLLALGNGSVNLSSDTLVMTLLTSAYTPAPDTDATWSNVSADEVATGNGYTQGGVVLTGTTWSKLAGASFTGSISGTALTVSAVTGTIYATALLQGASVAAQTFIQSGAGTSWVLNASQTVGSEAMTTAALNVLTFTAPTWAACSATFKYAALVHRAGASLAPTDILLGYFDASPGGGSVTAGGGTLTITPGSPGFLVNGRGA